MDDSARYDWIATQILPFEGEVRGWLRRRVRSLGAADIDDLIQESYSRIWAADRGHIANGRSYFYTVVRNLMYEQARRARIVPMERIGEIEALGIPDPGPEPDRHVSARQELACLQATVLELPPKCRRAFELQKFQGCTQREIAVHMQISEKTVEKHLAKALARVLDAMASESVNEARLPARPGLNEHGTAREDN